MHIRHFHETDRAALVELWEACDLSRPWNDANADIDRCLRSRDSALLVGLIDKTLVASLMMGQDGHRGWIYYLAVKSTERGHGRAREMVLEAELWLASRNVPKVQLMVRGANSGVTDFYKSLGYELQDVAVFGKWLARDT